MSDSEDSNFSEEEDSERSSDGEEAEVWSWGPGREDIASRDRAGAERPFVSGSFQIIGSHSAVEGQILGSSGKHRF
jgi:hypothetical protein